MILNIIILIFLHCCTCFLQPSGLTEAQPEERPKIDRWRFSLTTSGEDFKLTDIVLNKSITIARSVLINATDEESESEYYISSSHFSEKTTSFDIGNGLIGIHLSSFAATGEGSSKAACGRDLFLIYDPINSSLLDSSLNFGITKERIRFMGCLSAKFSNFIISDINQDGLTDIACIKDELLCSEYYDEYKNVDVLSGPVYRQHPVEWYIFKNKFWEKDDSYLRIHWHYTELPLLDIKLTPVDFFGHMKWRTYDPRKWQYVGTIRFIPGYRRGLIDMEKRRNELSKEKITEISSPESILNAGFMYWYAPLLLDVQWDLVVTGTVVDLSIDSSGRKLAYGKDFIVGKLKVQEILYRNLSLNKKRKSLGYISSNGFDGLKLGDKAIIFIIEYEGDYAIPSFSGTNCKIGYKLDSWQDPIINAVREYINLNQDMFKLIENKSLLQMWERYDPQSVQKIKEKVEVLKNHNK
jgi:hypothetical protein